MGKRGPKPTPTKILQVRGSWRGKAREEPTGLDRSCPRCPRRFRAGDGPEDAETAHLWARRLWKRLAGQLHAAGLLVAKDGIVFEGLCDAYGRWVVACGKLDAGGMVNEGKGTVSPWFRVRDSMAAQIAKGAACFGLSPADITGVKAMAKPTVEDEKKKFFGGAG